MTETSTITLTDFLLARFAEEEVAARDVLRARQLCTCTHHNLDEHFDNCAVWKQFGTLSNVGDPARVLAECEAKRQIVGYVQRVQRHAAQADPAAFDPEDAAALTHILRLLALPYAERHDYRVEWRPDRART